MIHIFEILGLLILGTLGVTIFFIGGSLISILVSVSISIIKDIIYDKR